MRGLGDVTSLEKQGSKEGDEERKIELKIVNLGKNRQRDETLRSPRKEEMNEQVRQPMQAERPYLCNHGQGKKGVYYGVLE